MGFVLDVDDFVAFGFDQVVDAVGGDGDEVGFVVAQIGGRIGVGDGETEAFGQPGDVVRVLGVLQEWAGISERLEKSRQFNNSPRVS